MCGEWDLNGDAEQVESFGSETSIHSVNIPKLSISSLILFFFPLSCYIAITFNTSPSQNSRTISVDEGGRHGKTGGKKRPSFQGKKRDPHIVITPPTPTHISAPQQKKTYNVLANGNISYGSPKTIRYCTPSSHTHLIQVCRVHT